MLVLRRKANETIVLNGVIKITVLGIEGDRVKIGIDASPDVIIVRGELLNEAENSTRHNPPHIIRIPAMDTADRTIADHHIYDDKQKEGSTE